MRRVEEVVGDRSYRRRVLSCIGKHGSPRKRFCCFLDALELPKLWRRYCRWHGIPLVIADIKNVLFGLTVLVGIFALPFLPILIAALLHVCGVMRIGAIELLVAEVMWIPIVIKIYMRVGDWFDD
jgi:hypothetical protein